MMRTMDISASALTANRIWAETIANNLANASTTRAGVDAQGNAVPYRRRQVHFELGGPGLPGGLGVRVSRIGTDRSPFPMERDPDHPDAIRGGAFDGMLRRPNVTSLVEMTDYIFASRAYEANMTILQGTKRMMEESFRILA